MSAVSAWVNSGKNKEIATLIYSRALVRFEGTFEPIEQRAGHISGALNRPYTENIAQDGKFKTSEKLKKEYLEVLNGNDPSSVVHMCGSGVTACHNLLSMEIAQLAGSSLYVGSWSEWSQNN